MPMDLSNQIIDLYNSSDSPVIVADENYSLIKTNKNAKTSLGLPKIADVLRVAKTQIGAASTGAFVFEGELNAHVQTISNDAQTVRVIHVLKKLTNQDTNPLFRATTAEMQFHRVMADLFETLNKYEGQLGEDFSEIEKSAYSVLELLTSTTQRYKNEHNLEARNESYFNITTLMNSILNQLDFVTKISNIRVAFDRNEIEGAVVKGDKEIIAKAVVKLVRSLCRFSSDDFIRVFQFANDDQIKYTFSVKSTQVIKWQEKNLTVSDLLRVVRDFDSLHDGILLTDALYEFKCEGVQTECEVTDSETLISITLPFEQKRNCKLNSVPVEYIGDPFSPLTVLFTGFKK